MMRKCLIVVGVLLFAATVIRAEPMRPLFSKENKMPGLHRLEVGVVGTYKEVPEEQPVGLATAKWDRDEYWGIPYARFGVTENFALLAEVPFASVDSQLNGDTQGLGDVLLGFELVAWQDIFRYPYVLPHAEVSLDTGDEEKGLGSGNTVVSAGLAIGTTVQNIFHWVLDGRYAMYSDADNIGSVAVAFIWDLGEQCSVLVEGKATDQDSKDGDTPAWLSAGLIYHATENLMLGAYGGTGSESSEDVIASLKVAYTF